MCREDFNIKIIKNEINLSRSEVRTFKLKLRDQSLIFKFKSVCIRYQYHAFKLNNMNTKSSDLGIQMIFLKLFLAILL